MENVYKHIRATLNLKRGLYYFAFKTCVTLRLKIYLYHNLF